MDVATNLGGAILSSTFSWLLSKLDSSGLSELLNSHKYVRKEVAKWRTLLPKIQVILEDAEQKQATNKLVKLFLGGLRELALDMEDILDELELDAKRKLIASPKASTSITQKLTPRWVKDREIASQIKSITTRLQHFGGEISTLDLINLAVNVEASSSKAVAERSLDSAMPEPRKVCGRESDKEKIFQMFDDEGNHEGYSVIPIVGMGGLGKTTLAGLVYYDDGKLKDYGFELKAWVCVSDVFDVAQITRVILQQVTRKKSDVDEITRVVLQQVTRKKSDVQDLFSLQEHLKKELSGKKFLLVLDDIWNEDYHSWDVLQRPFSDGAPGSKIIATTRNIFVAKTMRADDKVYNLDFLPEDECLSLFARHALDKENFDSHRELEGVGREIVERCRGLPLAVKVLGGLLRGKPNRQEWEDLLNRELCNLPEGQSGIYAVLKLSYNRLPPHLKRCFGFCAVFPKDYEFDKNELVLLWMAQGFLQQLSQEMKQMHDCGHQCFDILLSRSIFQPSIRDRSQFMMHDFISDLAQEVAGEICCSLDRLTLGDNKARHLSFAPREYDVLKRFEVLNEQKNLRTLLRLKWNNRHFSYPSLSNGVAVGILPKLKCLRVLSLCGVQKLPSSIGDLKHLRYINLSHSSIQSLPESVGSLLFLQTLILHDCEQLTRLPATIGNLIDLHYLDLTNTPSLTEIPLGVAKLRSLVLLTKFILGKADSGLRLKELKNLTGLQGQLSISNLHNLLDIEDAKDVKLHNMKLDDLSLEWASVCSDSQSKVKDFQVLECLKPGQRLERLTINCYCGEEFPSWIGDPSISQLKLLELRDCQNCTSLPSLGQLPQLKELIIKGSKAATLTGDSDKISSGNCFLSLEKLVLGDCCLLGKLPQELPSLKELLIVRCPQLTYSPVSLSSLQNLAIEECSEVVLRIMVDLSSLTDLKIFKISSLAFLPKKFLESMIALEVMCIDSCEELTCLWEEGANIANLAHLRQLSIRSCPLLTSVTAELKSLVQLSIWSCPNFKLFLSGQLPATLKNLIIERCENLESLPEGLMDDSNGDNMLQLEQLSLEDIATRNLFPSGLLPLDHMSSLSTLTYLEIDQVEGLESFPESGLGMPNLKYLGIYDCKNLRSLPNRMHNLTSLQSLSIVSCQRIESIPEGGLPTSLTYLDIGCENLKQPIKEWGLHRLTSLNSFNIGWICPLGDLLPTSLIVFGIFDLKNLKSLSRGLLQNLNSLQELLINDCPELQFLPKQGLPSSLGHLLIHNCPRLAQRLKEKQDDRRLIAHIPRVDID
ncbi:hypothetical protein SLEP1_g48644 [Rubroshorea leprosula]|uniref:Disease resistance RPP13-like protein 1 n=1 Tax=Rubroshorea leprosula TaxID=152421 RepID=A0AAV5LUA7_9ROSI|nr:hypothetical protein SLEP1_g48644 [Rubroshorea leprosula]